MKQPAKKPNKQPSNHKPLGLFVFQIMVLSIKLPIENIKGFDSSA